MSITASTGEPRRPVQAPRVGLPLGVQVALGVASVVALAVLAGVAAVVLLLHVTADQRRLDDRDVPYAAHVAQAALMAKSIANDERGFLLSGGGVLYRDEADRRVGVAHAAFAAAARSAATPAQRGAVLAAERGFDRWIITVRADFARYSASRRSTIAAANGPNRELRKSYEALLSRAQSLGTEAIDTQAARVDGASSRSIEILMATLLACIAAAAAIGVWLVRGVVRPVQELVLLLAGFERVQRL